MSDENKLKHDPSEDTSVNERRGVLKKIAGGSAAAIITLAHRPALGAVCNPSGHISSATHLSAVTRHGDSTTAGGCGAFSPGAWKKPYHGFPDTSGDGNYTHWKLVGYIPDQPNINPDSKQAAALQDWKDRFAGGATPVPTLVKSVFTASSYTGTFEQALDESKSPDASSFDRYSVNALLSVIYLHATGGGAGLIAASDVIGLYNAAKSGASYTLSTGNTVTFSESELEFFFAGLIH